MEITFFNMDLENMVKARKIDQIQLFTWAYLSIKMVFLFLLLLKKEISMNKKQSCLLKQESLKNTVNQNTYIVQMLDLIHIRLDFLT